MEPLTRNAPSDFGQLPNSIVEPQTTKSGIDDLVVQLSRQHLDNEDQGIGGSLSSSCSSPRQGSTTSLSDYGDDCNDSDGFVDSLVERLVEFATMALDLRKHKTDKVDRDDESEIHDVSDDDNTVVALDLTARSSSYSHAYAEKAVRNGNAVKRLSETERTELRRAYHKLIQLLRLDSSGPRGLGEPFRSVTVRRLQPFLLACLGEMKRKSRDGLAHFAATFGNASSIHGFLRVLVGESKQLTRSSSTPADAVGSAVAGAFIRPASFCRSPGTFGESPPVGEHHNTANGGPSVIAENRQKPQIICRGPAGRPRSSAAQNRHNPLRRADSADSAYPCAAAARPAASQYPPTKELNDLTHHLQQQHHIQHMSGPWHANGPHQPIQPVPLTAYHQRPSQYDPVMNNLNSPPSFVEDTPLDWEQLGKVLDVVIERYFKNNGDVDGVTQKDYDELYGNIGAIAPSPANRLGHQHVQHRLETDDANIMTPSPSGSSSSGHALLHHVDNSSLPNSPASPWQTSTVIGGYPPSPAGVLHPSPNSAFMSPPRSSSVVSNTSSGGSPSPANTGSPSPRYVEKQMTRLSLVNPQPHPPATFLHKSQPPPLIPLRQPLNHLNQPVVQPPTPVPHIPRPPTRQLVQQPVPVQRLPVSQSGPPKSMDDSSLVRHATSAPPARQQPGPNRFSSACQELVASLDPTLKEQALLLVTKSPIEALTMADGDGDTQLMVACANPNTKNEELYALVERLKGHPEPVKVFAACNRRRETALYLAVLERRPLFAGYLAETMSSLGISLNQTFQKTNTLIHEVSSWGDYQVLQYLIRVRTRDGSRPAFDLNAVNREGRCALHEAVMQYHRSDPESKNYFKTIELLLDYGADAGCSDKTSGKTPVHIAIEKRDPQLLELLLSKCPEAANAPMYNDNRPLHSAATLSGLTDVQQLELVNILLKYRADKTLRNKANKLPIELVQHDRDKVKAVLQARSRQSNNY